jgi:phospholipid/cholesterol/gamma-HCH transport system substrate-binding protein
MENKAHALAAGVFVLAMASLLVALAFWLTRDTGARSVYALSSKEAVSGLQPQAPVRFKGVLVGKVLAIEFDPKVKGNVLVRIAVDRGAPVTKSTFGALGYQGITGMAHIQLDDKGESNEPLRGDGDDPPRIPMRPGTTGLTGMMNRLSDQGGQVLVQLEVAVRRINELLAPDNPKGVARVVANTGDATQNVSALAADLNVLLKAQLDPKKLNVPGLVQDARSTLKSVQATSEQARGALARLGEKDGTLERVNESAATLSASTLPRVNRLADDATRTARQLNRTVTNLNENPQSLLYGGGAVPPGPGEPGFAAPAVQP